jgi:hypothetical protein
VTRTELGEALRQRQFAYVPGIQQLSRADKRVILRNLRSMTCDMLIDSYTTFACCGKKIMREEALNRVIATSTSAEDFIDRTGPDRSCA